MKLEVGKQYVMRNGSITGPLAEYGNVFSGRDMSTKASVRTWNSAGIWNYAHGVGDHEYDIVSEYALGHKERDEKEQECCDSLCGVASTVDATGIGAPKPEPAVRQFSTGATRNADNNKLDYEGFNCPMAQRAFAEYMHSHRKQADGTIRDSANWQKGMGLDVYAKSLIRHIHDFHCLHRGWEITRPEDGKPMPPDDEHKLELLCAIWFNVQGYIHETLKAQKKCDTSSVG